MQRPDRTRIGHPAGRAWGWVKNLLEILVRNPGRLVDQPTLLREVWGPGYERQLHYLRVYLAQLRRKLEPEPSRPRYLITHAGLGYRFDPAHDDHPHPHTDPT